MAHNFQYSGQEILHQMYQEYGLSGDMEAINFIFYGRIIILTDQDSVTCDTPLLLKNNNDLLEIKTICSFLSREYFCSIPVYIIPSNLYGHLYVVQ